VGKITQSAVDRNLDGVEVNAEVPGNPVKVFDSEACVGLRIGNGGHKLACLIIGAVHHSGHLHGGGSLGGSWEANHQFNRQVHIRLRKRGVLCKSTST